LDGPQLEQLRRATVWIDPAVQIWNRALLDNLDYGNGNCDASRIADALAACELHELIERLPSGLQTALGEGGGLLSGGAGQRVRTGRGLLRTSVRLVILDEPFRGLERARRARLPGAVGGRWPDATVLCITHDVHATLDFPRVLVLRSGQLVEDEQPGVLAIDPESEYHALLEAERVVESEIWNDGRWRRVQVGDGGLREEGRSA
jgi:ABC-type transport system involved in cytochrome bd biosynthesis fused ATPase/permease subunit